MIMKKLFPILAGLAAAGGAAYLLHRKYGKPSMVVTGEFEDDEPIVLDEEPVTEADEDAPADE